MNLKNNITRILCVFIICFIFIGWADNWDDIKKTAGNIKTISADFVQGKHMKILAKPLISKGHFLYATPDSLRWEYKSPIHSVLLMNKGDLSKYVKSNNKFIRDSTASVQGMKIVMQEITGWLGGQFDKNPDFIARLEPGRAAKITLTPANKSLGDIIKKIELILSQEPGVIKTVKIFESDDAYTIINFKNVIINKKIDEAVFLKIQ